MAVHGRARFNALDFIAGASSNLEDMSFEAMNDLPNQAFEGLDFLKSDSMPKSPFDMTLFDSPSTLAVGNVKQAHHHRGLRVGNIEELHLCEAWRPVPGPKGVQPKLEKCVAHRVHPEDYTVTVQFFKDQHRLRIPVSCCRPLLDITPEYPQIYISDGEAPPSREEIDLYEEEKSRLEAHGMVAPLFDGPDPTLGSKERATYWGLPTPTLDALRNRSIPPAQVTGEYGRHFYTSLYNRQASEANKRHTPVTSEPEVHLQHGKSQAKVTLKRRYIQLDGTELVQQEDGSWLNAADIESHTFFGQLFNA
jgi:hypothetical protein